MINIIHQDEERITECKDIEISENNNVYHICAILNKTLSDFLSCKKYTCISMGFFKDKSDAMLVMRALYDAIDKGKRIFKIPVDNKFYINSLCSAFEITIDEYNKKENNYVDA